MEDINPGDYVKININGEEHICLVIITQHTNLCLLFEKHVGTSEALGSHVTSNLYNLNQFRCVPNIADYHGKQHSWYYSGYVVKTSCPNQLTTINRKCDGCSCSVCGCFVMMAEPNQPNNTFKCYSCRNNSMRAFY